MKEFNKKFNSLKTPIEDEFKISVQDKIITLDEGMEYVIKEMDNMFNYTVNLKN